MASGAAALLAAYGCSLARAAALLAAYGCSLARAAALLAAYGCSFALTYILNGKTEERKST